MIVDFLFLLVPSVMFTFLFHLPSAVINSLFKQIRDINSPRVPRVALPDAHGAVSFQRWIHTHTYTHLCQTTRPIKRRRKEIVHNRQNQ